MQRTVQDAWMNHSLCAKAAWAVFFRLAGLFYNV